MKFLLLILFLSLQVFAHEDSSIDQIADQFVITEESMDEGKKELRERIDLLIYKLSNLKTSVPEYERNQFFIDGSGVSKVHKNAAADILIEMIDASLDFTEHHMTCHHCDTEMPQTYKAAILNEIQSMKRLIQTAEGTPFEKLNFVLFNMQLSAQIKTNDIIGNTVRFLKSFGVKIAGDLSEIYGERGTIALALVGLTWFPYTAVTETIEHSLIGPFAVFCMTSQLIYFAAVKAVFNTASNAKNLFLSSLFSNRSSSVVSDFFKMMSFEAKIRFKFGYFVSNNLQTHQSRNELKKSLHVDLMSRLQNIGIGFSNFIKKKAYQMGISSDYKPKELNKIRIDPFLYSALKTHNWSDVAFVNENHDQMNSTKSIEDSKSLEILLNDLLKQNKNLEAYMIIKEIYTVTDILRKQVSSSLRLQKESGLITLSKYLYLKAQLGRIFYDLQKIRFMSLLKVTRSKENILMVQSLLNAHQVLIKSIKNLNELSQSVSRGEPVNNLKDFSLEQKLRTHQVYRAIYEFESSCQSFFVLN